MDWRKRLLELKNELLAEADDGEKSSAIVELDQTKVGRLSRMDAMQAQAMSLAAKQRRESGLKNIEAALLRVESGIFGNCENCDEAINPKRLEFDPTVLLCIDCASNAEDQ